MFSLHCFAQTDTTEKVYDFVEQIPEFPGGNKAMTAFLSQNIVYPEYERVNNIQGRVVLKFIVNTDGSVSGIQVLKSISPGINAEAIRVVQLLPKFKPAYHEGKPVRLYFTLPISFKLAEPEKKDSLRLNEVPELERIYTFVEQNPQFPGGDEEIMKFVNKHLQIPKDYKSNENQPKVLIRFIVNEDGSVSDVEVRKSIDPVLDAEAVRVVKMLPHFTPGKQHGKRVKVYYNMPVIFKLTSQSPETSNTPLGPDTDGVYTLVETNPEYPGGNEKLINFIKKNITYPKYEQDNDIEGTVWVKFVIDTDGSVTKVCVRNPVSPGLDETAIKIVKMLPRFKPGKQQGKPVKVYFNLPVQFRLTDKN